MCVCVCVCVCVCITGRPLPASFPHVNESFCHKNFFFVLLLKAYVLELRLSSKNIEAQYINLEQEFDERPLPTQRCPTMPTHPWNIYLEHSLKTPANSCELCIRTSLFHHVFLKHGRTQSQSLLFVIF